MDSLNLLRIIFFILADFYFFLELHTYLFIYFWLRHTACGIFPDQGLNQGSNQRPLHWEHRVLTSGPPGKSLADCL